MIGSQTTHLRDYLHALRQHHFKIVLAFSLTFGAACVLSFYLPRAYQASTLIEVQSTQRSPSPSATIFQSFLSGGLNTSEMENLARRFTTGSLLRSVVDALETEGNPGAEHLPSIGKLKENIAARIVPDTSYINLSVKLPERHGGERNAALIANRLVEMVQDWRRVENQQQSASRRRILDEQLGQLQHELEDQQRALLDFMQRQGSPATWYPMLTSLLERRMDLNEAEQRIRTALQTTRAEKELIQDKLDSQEKFVRTSETLTTDPLWTNIQTELMSVNAAIAEAASRYGEQSDEWIGLQRKREEWRRQAEVHVERTVSATTRGVSAIYLSLLERLWTVENQILRAQKEREIMQSETMLVERQLDELIQSLPPQQFNFDLIRRKIDALYSVLLELQKQNVEVQILLAETESSQESSMPHPVRGGIVVIDRAEPRKIPVEPNQRLILMLASVAGIGIGLVWALASEFVAQMDEPPR